MKKLLTVLLVALAVTLCGAAGFFGTYFANTLSISERNASISEQESSVKSGNIELENSPEKPSSSLDITGSASNEIFLSNKNEDNAKSLTIPEISAVALNSVVEIYTETVTTSRRFGQYVTEGAGSGVIISADGYIVTNNHVIEGSSKIKVRLNNGSDYDAVLIGRDTKTDLAVVKINAPGLQPAVYGDSDNLVIGELAVAIGNPLGQLGGTVTDGIISALSRNIVIDGYTMDLLQTSAAVNPGNSGGGLFNGCGELVGIVNAKSGGSDIEGIGFAIPVNLVKQITGELIEFGYVPGRVDFGVALIDILDPITAMMYRVQTTGVYVSQADSDSSLNAGDCIISIEGKDIKSTSDINEILKPYKAGDALSITILRNNKTITVTHVLKQAVA